MLDLVIYDGWLRRPQTNNTIEEGDKNNNV